MTDEPPSDFSRINCRYFDSICLPLEENIGRICETMRLSGWTCPAEEIFSKYPLSSTNQQCYNQNDARTNIQ